nr:hypothetical protein [Tanacetum cinerariifolium]
MLSENVIREILQLDDAEGVVCLPNEEIFVGLAQMGYEKPSTKLTFYKAFFSSQWKFLIHTILQSLSAKRTSWNEFSTAMASAVICLSKVGDLSTHSTRYISPALTQKADGAVAAAVQENVAENVAKNVAKTVTENVTEDVANEAIPSPPSHDIPSPSQEQTLPPQQPHISPQVPPQEHDNVALKLGIIKLKARVKRLERANQVKSSKLKRLRKVETSQRIESFNDMEDIFNRGRMITKDEGIELVKNPSIPAAAPIVVAAYTRRRNRVIIRDPEEKLSLKTPAETPGLKDKGKGILVESPKPMKKKDQIKLDAEYARKLHEEINKDHEKINKDIDWDAAMDHNTAGYKMDFFKGMSYADICPIFQARFDENMRFLFKSREEIEEEDQEIIKSINETLTQKAAKRRKLNEEAREAEELKNLLEISNINAARLKLKLFKDIVAAADAKVKRLVLQILELLSFHILENQVGDLSTHTTRFISPALTQKVFANMRRVGKGFSGVETPLFEGMLAENVAENVSHAAIPSPPPHDIPSPSQEPSSPPQQQKCVEYLETANAAQKLEIVQLKAKVKKLKKANKIKSLKLRRLRKVGTSRRVESSDDMEDVFNQERMIADMDMNEGIELVKDAEVAESEGRNAAEHAEKQAKIYNLDLDHSVKVLSMQEDDSEVQEVVEVVTTAKLITEVVTAAASQVSTASTTIPAASATIPGAKPSIPAAATTGVIIRDPKEELPLKTPAETPKVKDKDKGILVDAPKPMKKKDQIEMDAEYARKEEMEAEDQEIIKSINETLAQKAAKRRKLSKEAQKAENLRKQLEVVEDEDDDVFVDATPLA